MNIDDLPIEWPENRSSIIKVVGVGGGGGNAVSYMYRQGIHNVNFVICNTDAQALAKSPVPVKIQLGKGKTEGLGAGNKPEVGREAALDSLDEIREVLDTGTRMVFVTAGMGGGTGTGAAPVIARVARELGILTVAIVTIPFRFEGMQRFKQALEGINELKEHVDSLLVINNEKLREMYGDLKIRDAFSKADNVLTMAAKGIAELITLPGDVNVDFADVSAIMTGGGITVMGSAAVSGANRAREAVEAALNSPLLNNNDITGARRILLNITSGTGDNEVTMDELTEITDYVTHSAKNASMIWGAGNDDSLGDAVCVTIVATDFPNSCFVDPALEITGKPKEKRVDVQLSGNSEPGKTTPRPDDHPLDTTLPGNPGKYTVRDKPASTQTEIKWNPSEAAVETETAEWVRPVPSITDENANIDELENTPAYIRKKNKMDNRLSGTENEVSKYTLSSDKENTVRLRDNNSYLYDVVD
ncbi:MAG: cell division protein FtsZ [Bacteroidales bacterium]|jgi:cell division protein FtsZ|nr:cell division protein FtsZ [Bacteroidales bacterium]